MKKPTLAAPVHTDTFCRWTYDSWHDHYDTACDNAAVFGEGDVLANEYKFCPYCGKPIEVVPEVVEDDEEDE